MAYVVQPDQDSVLQANAGGVMQTPGLPGGNAPQQGPVQTSGGTATPEGATGSSTVGTGGAAIAGTSGTNQAAPTHSGNFTNLNTYIGANAPGATQLAGTVAGNIGNQANQASQAYSQTAQDFTQAAGAGTPTYDPNFISNVLANPVGAAQDTTQLASIKNMLSGTYGGPSDVSQVGSFAQASQANQNIGNIQQEAKTPAGQQQLISSTPGQNSTMGGNSLNQLLIQNTPEANQQFTGAVANTQPLNQTFAGLSTNAQQQVQQAKQTAQQTQQQTNQALVGGQTDIQTQITAEQKAQQDRASAQQAALNALLTGATTNPNQFTFLSPTEQAAMTLQDQTTTANQAIASVSAAQKAFNANPTAETAQALQQTMQTVTGSLSPNKDLAAKEQTALQAAQGAITLQQNIAYVKANPTQNPNGGVALDNLNKVGITDPVFGTLSLDQQNNLVKLAGTGNIAGFNSAAQTMGLQNADIVKIANLPWVLNGKPAPGAGQMYNQYGYTTFAPNTSTQVLTPTTFTPPNFANMTATQVAQTLGWKVWTTPYGIAASPPGSNSGSYITGMTGAQMLAKAGGAASGLTANTYGSNLPYGQVNNTMGWVNVSLPATTAYKSASDYSGQQTPYAVPAQTVSVPPQWFTQRTLSQAADNRSTPGFDIYHVNLPNGQSGYVVSGFSSYAEGQQMLSNDIAGPLGGVALGPLSKMNGAPNVSSRGYLFSYNPASSLVQYAGLNGGMYNPGVSVGKSNWLSVGAALLAFAAPAIMGAIAPLLEGASAGVTGGTLATTGAGASSAGLGLTAAGAGTGLASDVAATGLGLTAAGGGGLGLSAAAAGAGLGAGLASALPAITGSGIEAATAGAGAAAGGATGGLSAGAGALNTANLPAGATLSGNTVTLANGATLPASTANQLGPEALQSLSGVGKDVATQAIGAINTGNSGLLSSLGLGNISTNKLVMGLLLANSLGGKVPVGTGGAPAPTQTQQVAAPASAFTSAPTVDKATVALHNGQSLPDSELAALGISKDQWNQLLTLQAQAQAKGGGVDLKAYLNAQNPTTAITPQMAATQDQIARWNALNQLIGTNNPWLNATSPTATPNLNSFNISGAEQSLSQQIQASTALAQQQAAAGAASGQSQQAQQAAAKQAAQMTVVGGVVAGASIGAAVSDGVGAVVGGVIGGIVGLVCFLQGSKVLMKDGTVKLIEDVKLGNEIMLGGTVFARGEAYCTLDLYQYRGQHVTGGHAVFEDGEWIRVQDSKQATLVILPEGQGVIVYPIVSQHHLMVVGDFISADFAECEDPNYEMNAQQRLDYLNGWDVRNEQLMEILEKVFPEKFQKA